MLLETEQLMEDWDDGDESGGPRHLIEPWCDVLLRLEQSFRGGDQRDPKLARLPYPQYLRTPHWQDMRKRALKRAGYRCKRCESRGLRLDVHHLTYDRLGREFESDLTVLCEFCHAQEHAAA